MLERKTRKIKGTIQETRRKFNNALSIHDREDIVADRPLKVLDWRSVALDLTTRPPKGSGGDDVSTLAAYFISLNGKINFGEL